MDTAEADTTASDSQADLVYDGFLSYSHGADGLLAPRLQAGLQRFAKPWWRRRALRIFRDDASLSANPHLWSSITEALNNSGWFVLLMSPDAAESPWVNREVEYWLQHKDSDRIIPVLTEGDFVWADGGFSSDAAPPALQGAFSNEPRWVDLRFAGSEEQLDLNNPRFSAAVADIASALRGVPKDELESEEVRQHRRTLRTAWAAGTVVVILALLATAAAVFAVRQRNEARTQQAAAEAAASSEAEQRAVAEEQARIAYVRGLSSASDANLDVDPELSVLLAIEAVRQSGEDVLPEAEEALHKAVQADRLLLQRPSAGAAFFSADGESFIGGGAGVVPVWDAKTGEETLTLLGHTGPVFNAVYSADGAFIATNSFDGTTRLWNAGTGEELWRIEIEESNPLSVAISPDSRLLATSAEEVVRVWDIATRKLVATLVHTDPVGINFGPNGLLAVADGESVKVWDVETTELVAALPMPDGAVDVAFAPDGSFLAVTDTTDGLVYDAETWEQQHALFGHADAPGAIDVDPSGTLVATGANDGKVRLFAADTGRPVLTLAGHDGAVLNVAFGPDGSLVASGGTDDTTRLWDISETAGAEWFSIPSFAGDVDYSPNGRWIATSSFSAEIREAGSGEKLVPLEGHEDFIRRVQFSPDGLLVATASFDGTTRLWDIETGTERLLIPGFAGGVDFSPDGSRIATSGETHVRVFDAETGVEQLAVKAYEPPELFEAPGLADVEFSPDGQWFATSGFDGWIKMWDAADGTLIWEREGHTGFNPVSLQVDFSPDGTMLASISWDGTAKIWDPATGDVIRRMGGVAGAELWAVDFSPDGRLLATGGGDGSVTLWDVEEGVRRLTLGTHPVTVFGVEFSPDGTRLATGSFDDILRVYVIDVDELALIAQQRLSRWWTEEECLQYLQMGVCPQSPPGIDF